tara:strand:- start:9262 stop:10527 length:1266 start_codon:yes stop_codon:yes gene_type:complete
MINKTVFCNRNFQILWGGSVISVLGDQLSLIAIPWLVLHMTQDVLSVGLVLSVMSLPRAIFILWGGVLTDRYDPLRILKLTRICSFLLTTALALCIAYHQVHLSLMVIIALGLGLTSALASPALMSMLPLILKPEALRAGNSIMMMNMQLSAIIGPALAGFLLSLEYSTQMTSSSSMGYVVVFSLDALSFLLAGLSLYAMRLSTQNKPSQASAASFIDFIRSCYAYIKKDQTLTLYLAYIACMSFFIVGPSSVGLPILVKEKFMGDAQLLGFFMTTQGLGMTLGMVLVMFLPTLPAAKFGMVLFSLDTLAGLFVLIFSQLVQIQFMYILLFCIGLISGYIQVTAYVWIQQRIETVYMGRVMAILMFASIGLVPLSSALASAVIQISSVTVLFEIMGIAVIMFAVIALNHSQLKNMGVLKPQ